MIVHEQDTARLGDFPVSLIDGRFDVGGSAVGIVCQYIYDERSSTQSVSFKSAFFEISHRGFGGSLYGAIDVFDRDGCLLGRLDDIVEPAIGVGVGAAAVFDRHDDFLAEEGVGFGFLHVRFGLGGSSDSGSATHLERSDAGCRRGLWNGKSTGCAGENGQKSEGSSHFCAVW